MELRKMAAIFLGASVVLLGAYALANRGGNEPQASETKNENLFSAGGSATVGQDAGTNQGWGDFLSGNAAKESPEDKNNVTKNIAKAAFEQMKALDQQGKSPFDQANTNTPEVQAAIESSLDGSVDSFYGNVAVSEGDIKISANNTQAAKRDYLKMIEGILARHTVNDQYENISGGVQGLVETTCTDGDSGAAKNIAGIYDATAKDFIAARVPSTWASFHMQAIEHYKKGAIIFNAVSNCINDPIKGIAAAQKLPTFGMDALTLQNLLKKMYNEVGL